MTFMHKTKEALQNDKPFKFWITVNFLYKKIIASTGQFP